MKKRTAAETHPLFQIETYAGWTVHKPYAVNVHTLVKSVEDGEVSITFTRRLDGWEPVIDATAILPRGRTVTIAHSHPADADVKRFWGELNDRAYRDEQTLNDAAQRSVMEMLGIE